MIRLALALTFTLTLAITLTLAAAQTRLITLGDACDWSSVTEISAYDFETRHEFAVALDLVRSWRGDSFYAKDHWDIPPSAKLRYQLTLRTPDEWFTVHVLLDGDTAYVMAFDSHDAGTDVQHPCAALRVLASELGLTQGTS